MEQPLCVFFLQNSSLFCFQTTHCAKSKKSSSCEVMGIILHAIDWGETVRMKHPKNKNKVCFGAMSLVYPMA